MQKENEEDGSITFSFPKGYRFRGGIEDAPPADDGTTDSGETVVSTLHASLPQDWGCCVVCGIDSCERHASLPALGIRAGSCQELNSVRLGEKRAGVALTAAEAYMTSSRCWGSSSVAGPIL